MSWSKQFKDRLLTVVGKLPPVRHATNWVQRAGTTIFTFHRVLPRGAECFDPELRTSEDAFSDFLDWVEEDYKVVTLDEAAAGNGNLPPGKLPKCAITFDDGWLDNFTCAFPQLQRRGLPATIFLPTRYMGRDRKFWQELLWLCTKELKSREDGCAAIEKVARRLPWFPPTEGDLTSYRFLRRLLLTRPSTEAEEFTHRVAEASGLANAFPERSFVNWEEVKQMQAAGILFGSHTLNHTLLPNASPRVAEQEIEASREELKARIGYDVAGFAYPWGAVGPGSLGQIRKAGYRFAVTTKPGLVRCSSDRFLLPRVAVSDSVLDGGEGIFDRGKARLSFTKNILTGSTKRFFQRAKENHDRRVKILFVLDLITEWEGGTERQLRLLIQSLDRQYFEPKLCFLFEAPELAEESLPCPLRVVCRRSERLPSVPVRLWRLIRVLREERPDIIQCFFREGLMIGILAGRIANVPQVVGSARNEGYWRKPTHRVIMKLITRLAHRWQTNSRALWRLQKNREAVPADLIEILPNGTDLSGFAPATPAERRQAREKLELNVNGPICVSVANFAKVKDVGTVIDAAKLLKDRLPSAQFVLVGDGPLRDELKEQAARLGVLGSVKFVGRQADVRPFLAAADLGVLTSRSEGSSNSVLEYMAVGLPVVLSDIPPNRELLEGVFFQPGDAVDFAEKLMRLWNALSMRAYTADENRQDLAEFSLENMILRAESFYGRLAVARGK